MCLNSAFTVHFMRTKLSAASQYKEKVDHYSQSLQLTCVRSTIVFGLGLVFVKDVGRKVRQGNPALSQVAQMKMGCRSDWVHRQVRRLKCQNTQRLILVLPLSCDRNWRLAAEVCAQKQKSETTLQCYKKYVR